MFNVAPSLRRFGEQRLSLVEAAMRLLVRGVVRLARVSLGGKFFFCDLPRVVRHVVPVVSSVVPLNDK
jgi:hypothetical protein